MVAEQAGPDGRAGDLRDRRPPRLDDERDPRQRAERNVDSGTVPKGLARMTMDQLKEEARKCNVVLRASHKGCSGKDDPRCPWSPERHHRPFRDVLGVGLCPSAGSLLGVGGGRGDPGVGVGRPEAHRSVVDGPEEGEDEQGEGRGPTRERPREELEAGTTARDGGGEQRRMVEGVPENAKQPSLEPAPPQGGGVRARHDQGGAGGAPGTHGQAAADGEQPGGQGRRRQEAQGGDAADLVHQAEPLGREAGEDPKARVNAGEVPLDLYSFDISK